MGQPARRWVVTGFRPSPMVVFLGGVGEVAETMARAGVNRSIEIFAKLKVVHSIREIMDWKPGCSFALTEFA
jgi:hypothetical protein